MIASRFPSGVELRAAPAEMRAAGRKLEGHAALFDVPAMIGGRFEERIARGAFAASLTPDADVLALADHDPTRLIGRTRSGTLRLAEDGAGLAFSVDVPDTGLGRDLLEMATRGDLGGMSFAFTVPPGGDKWIGENRRTLLNVSLKEISVVQAWPAYPQTSVAARARQPGTDAIRARRRYLERL